MQSNISGSIMKMDSDIRQNDERYFSF